MIPTWVVERKKVIQEEKRREESGNSMVSDGALVSWERRHCLEKSILISYLLIASCVKQ